jgi:hypothetical protein
MRFLRTLAAIAAAFIVAPAFAAGVSTGAVTETFTDTVTGKVWFKMSVVPTGQPACATYVGSGHFYYDASSVVGKITDARVQTAHLTGASVTVTGTNACGTGTGFTTAEVVKSFQFLPLAP